MGFGAIDNDDDDDNNNNNSVALVRERMIPTERPPLIIYLQFI
jgi:hypothetical protein